MKKEPDLHPQIRDLIRSYARLKDHLDGVNFALLGAHDRQQSPEENKKSHGALKSAILGARFGILNLHGTFKLSATPDDPADEVLYLAIGRYGDDSGEIKGFAKKCVQTFPACGAVYKEAAHPDAQLVQPGRKQNSPPSIRSLDSWKPSRIPQYYTLMTHSPTPFTLHSILTQRSFFSRRGSPF